MILLKLTKTLFAGRNYSQLLIVLVGFIGCFLPVWELKPVGLKFTAYELAEWASLYPGSQELAFSLVTSLGFRLVGIGSIWLLQLALLTAGLPRLMYWSIVMTSGVALLPPLEFLNEWTLSSNYRQQLIIAIISWFGSCVYYLLYVRRKQTAAYSVCIALIAFGGIVGLTQSQVMLMGLQLAPEAGIGPLLTAASIAINLVISRGRI